MALTPTEKTKLTDAFRKAVEGSPHADKPIPGIVGPDGASATPRQLMEATLASPEASEQLFTQAEAIMKGRNLTLDQLIEKTFKAPKPPTP